MEEDERRRIGERIGRARRESGLTQRELAERLGITVRSVQNYESGKVVPYRHFKVIEEIAHRRHGWILDGDEPFPALHESVSSLTRAMERHASLIEQLTDQLERLREGRARTRHRTGIG